MDETRNRTREHSISPIEAGTRSTGKTGATSECITALPQFALDAKVSTVRTTTFDDFTMPSIPHPQPTIPVLSRLVNHKMPSSLDLIARLNGDGLLEPSDEVRERRDKQKLQEQQRKNKGWSLGVNITRFTHLKGVKEMI
jgi:hypothetical protein